MRFFLSALAASLVVAVAGAAIRRGADPVIKETCRGMIHWSEAGFYRSGTTVRYHGHMWQCTRWSKGENPETSDIWRDLGACDPDAMGTQLVLSKRSVPLEARDEEPSNCRGFLEWESGATYRSGATVHHKGALWQTHRWTKADEPGVSDVWFLVTTCENTPKKLKRSGCDGFLNYDDGALYRPGTTVDYESEVYQAKRWVKKTPPTNTEAWAHIGSC